MTEEAGVVEVGMEVEGAMVAVVATRQSPSELTRKLLSVVRV